jgi:hypothetical protein
MLCLVDLLVLEDGEHQNFLCMLPLHQDEEHSWIFLFEPLQAASSADDEHRYREREVSRWH